MNWKLSEILFNVVEVSDYGYVRNAKNKKVYKLQIHRNGYAYINTTINGKVYSKRVHKLIAAAFMPNPDNFSDINHKNGIKIDNRIENLEWCTRRENILHGIRIGLINYDSRRGKRRA